MKLNGWQRIGIITSVLWILATGFYVLSATSADDAKEASDVGLECERYISQGVTTLAECDKRSADYVAKTRAAEWELAGLAALVPVPFGWGFIYLVAFLVRWVKRGWS
jgi:hypothetical protein